MPRPILICLVGLACACLCGFRARALAPGEDAPAEQAIAPLILQSNFIFRGTVEVMEPPATKLLAEKDKAVGIRLNRALKAPDALGTLASLSKRKPLVLLRPRAGLHPLKKGQQFIFFARLALAGSEMVADEVDRVTLEAGRLSLMRADAAGGQKVAVEAPEEHLEELASQTSRLRFQQRSAAANLVIAGKVVSVSTAPPPPIPNAKRPHPISEHNPKWRIAVVEVESVLKTVAATKPKRVAILFPGSRDVAWAAAPKFDRNSAGVWNLRSNRVTQRYAASKHLKTLALSDMPIYTALHPGDFHPLDATQRRKVMAAPKAFLEPAKTFWKRSEGVPEATAPRRSRPPQAGPTPKPARRFAAQNILVVNMIPPAFSGEKAQDSEPFLAVHPRQQLLLGSAFTFKDPEDGTSPVYVSTDGGQTWALNFTVEADQVADQTFAFDVEKGDTLYGAIIKRPNMTVPVLSTDDPQLSTVMKLLSDFPALPGSNLHADQPFLQARSFAEGDRIYIGENNFDPDLASGTASVRTSVDGRTFTPIGLETRTPLVQNAPSVRTAIAKDGTVYVGFMAWRTQNSDQRFVGDVIVCRDDEGATGASPYRSLVDPDDRKPGRLVARRCVFPFNDQLGQERIGSSLSLAVDPNHSSTVYLAWADRDSTTGAYTIHLRRSIDRGKTWSDDVQTISSATNPALAVADDGTAALLYQQLARPGAPDEAWETHLLRSEDGFVGVKDLVLARVPTAGEPTAQFLPFLGDYAHLVAIQNTFYGIFAAANAPVLSHFPAGVTFLRRQENGKLLTQDGSEEVPPSIDPFFFRVPSKAQPAPTDGDTLASNGGVTASGRVQSLSLDGKQVRVELDGTGQRRWQLDRSRGGDDQRIFSQLLVDAYLRQTAVELSGPVREGIGRIEKIGVGAAAEGPSRAKTIRSPKGRTYRLIPTSDRGNFAEDRPAPEAAARNDGEHFAGRARKVAKTSASRADPETFGRVDVLLGSLAADRDMRPKLSPNSRRIAEEDRNVTVQAFLYATKKEADNDFHLLLGTDPSADNPRYMTAEISGLPMPANAFSDVIQDARQALKDFFGDAPLPGSRYVKFDPPVPVLVTGSLFFDIDHHPGEVGTGSIRPDTVWEIHPVTKIVFEPEASPARRGETATPRRSEKLPTLRQR